MYSRINYTLVGIFVLLFGAALVAFGFWLARYGFHRSYDRYVLVFDEPVDGLSPDSTVHLNGVEVGRVTAIELDPHNPARVRVTIRVNSGTPITQGMYGVLKAQGITGLSYIQIEGGSSGAPRLRARGEQVPIIPTRESLMHRLTSNAPKILDDLNASLASIRQLLSAQNRKHVEAILANTERASRRAEDLEERIIALAGDFNRTLHRFDERSAQLIDDYHRIGKRLDERIDPLLDRIEAAGRNFARLSRDLDRKIRRGEYDLRKIVRPIRIDISELSHQYQDLAQDLKELSRHPSSILFGAPHPPKGPGE